MAINPYMKAEMPQHRQTYVDKYVPLPFAEMQQAAAIKQKQYDDVLDKFTSLPEDAQGYTGTGDMALKSYSRGTQDRISNFIDEHPDLAKDSREAHKLIREISKEQKYGMPALLKQEREVEKKHREFLDTVHEKGTASASWMADELFKANTQRTNEQLSKGELLDVGKEGLGVNRLDAAMKASSEIEKTDMSRMAPNQLQNINWLIQYAKSKGIEATTVDAVTSQSLLNDRDYINQVKNDIRMSKGDVFYDPKTDEIINEVLKDVDTEVKRRTHKLTDYGYKSAPAALFGGGQKLAPAYLYQTTQGPLFNQKSKYQIKNLKDLNSQIANLNNIDQQKNLSPAQRQQNKNALNDLNAYRSSIRENLLSNEKVKGQAKQNLINQIPALYPDRDPSISKSTFEKAVTDHQFDRYYNELIDLALDSYNKGVLERVENPNTGLYEIKFNPESTEKIDLPSQVYRILKEGITKGVGNEDPTQWQTDDMLNIMGDVINGYVEEMGKDPQIKAYRVGMDMNNKYVKNQNLYRTMSGMTGWNDKNNTFNADFLNQNVHAVSPITGEEVDDDSSRKAVLASPDSKMTKVEPVVLGNELLLEVSYDIVDGSGDVESSGNSIYLKPKGDNKEHYKAIKEAWISDFNNAIASGSQIGPTEHNNNKTAIYSLYNPNISEYNKIKDGGKDIKTINVTPVNSKNYNTVGILDYNFGMPISNMTESFEISKENGIFRVNGKDTGISTPTDLDAYLQALIQKRRGQ